MAHKSKQRLRLQLAVLLAAFALLALIGSVSAVSSKTWVDRSLRSDRSLRRKGANNLLEVRTTGLITQITNAVKQSSADKLFTKYKVNQLESNLLANAEFQTWARAVINANKKNPQLADQFIASTLSSRIGDGALAKMLAAAKKDKTFEITASGLEAAQRMNRLEKDRLVREVFTLLKLDQEEIVSPVFDTWFSYAMLNADPGEKVLGTLLRHYNFEIPVSLLAAGRSAWKPQVRSLGGLP
ncbi:hypothetical protein PHYSODRAFT_249162 [Phytophthora sojae]|uniref:RxLR effector protein n=1 Tax=Phytophthora sojae (strain P6497) TaxID=1094619 RepID=G4ZNR9_PHYSP|nr:hypothetical protein PHYSODRAFT_249162 [Phytophthora sojae]EGZ15092.1 hypothetical protein PHYSODRAFT_249162 [Phytophthora sojae]|eukprot:XP_009528841.1 hypothetical protein PHYSODRAFT_249162 [Phytophthora sojae]